MIILLFIFTATFISLAISGIATGIYTLIKKNKGEAHKEKRNEFFKTVLFSMFCVSAIIFIFLLAISFYFSRYF